MPGKKESWCLLENAAATPLWNPHRLQFLTVCLGSWLGEANAAKPTTKYGVIAGSATIARMKNSNGNVQCARLAGMASTSTIVAATFAIQKQVQKFALQCCKR